MDHNEIVYDKQGNKHVIKPTRGVTVIEGMDKVWQRERDKSLLQIPRLNAQIEHLKADIRYQRGKSIAWKKMMKDRPGTFKSDSMKKAFEEMEDIVETNGSLKKRLELELAKHIEIVATMDERLKEYFKGISILAQARKEEIEENADSNRLHE